jgi:hypothetical protein
VCRRPSRGTVATAASWASVSRVASDVGTLFSVLRLLTIPSVTRPSSTVTPTVPMPCGPMVTKSRGSSPFRS